jgi:hypothetical protein
MRETAVPFFVAIVVIACEQPGTPTAYVMPFHP